MKRRRVHARTVVTLTHEVDSDRLLEDGYIVIRDMIPSRQLAELRVSFDRMFERQRAVSGEA